MCCFFLFFCFARTRAAQSDVAADSGGVLWVTLVQARAVSVPVQVPVSRAMSVSSAGGSSGYLSPSSSR
eukprot:2693523-Pyramimonas_sp.AAC.1